MKRVCQLFIDFLQRGPGVVSDENGEERPLSSQHLRVYDQTAHKGVYRLLTVRYSKRTGGLLLMLCVSLKDTGK
jgi:hypothetical protein